MCTSKFYLSIYTYLRVKLTQPHRCRYRCRSESSFDFNVPNTISDACKLYTHDNIIIINDHTEHDIIQIPGVLANNFFSNLFSFEKRVNILCNINCIFDG